MSQVLSVLGIFLSYFWYQGAAFGVGYLLAGRKMPTLEQGIAVGVVTTIMWSLIQVGLFKDRLKRIEEAIRLRRAPGDLD